MRFCLGRVGAQRSFVAAGAKNDQTAGNTEESIGYVLLRKYEVVRDRPLLRID